MRIGLLVVIFGQGRLSLRRRLDAKGTGGYIFLGSSLMRCCPEVVVCDIQCDLCADLLSVTVARANRQVFRM